MKVTYYFPGGALKCLNHQQNKSVKNDTVHFLLLLFHGDSVAHHTLTLGAPLNKVLNLPLPSFIGRDGFSFSSPSSTFFFIVVVKIWPDEMIWFLHLGLLFKKKKRKCGKHDKAKQRENMSSGCCGICFFVCLIAQQK